MKKISLKNKMVNGICLVALACLPVAHAHDIPGSLSNGALNGAGSGATDIYSIQCALDPLEASQQATDHLFIQVRDDSTAGGQVSATAILNTNPLGVQNSSAISVTDTIPAPADSIAGPSRTLKANPVAQDVSYTVFVHHTAAALDNYLVSVHCQDAAGVHTGTTYNAIQNQ